MLHIYFEKLQSECSTLTNYLKFRDSVPVCDVVCVYCTINRSVLEYACPVWHPGLNRNIIKDIEQVQKCCLKLLYPSLSYTEALCKSGLARLVYQRD